jgi:hypothetical protein
MTQDNIRRLVFAILVLPISVGLFFVEWYDAADSALVTYSITATLMYICLTIWTCWGIKSRKRPTTIFKVNWLLIAGMTLSISVEIYARWLRFEDPVAYTELVANNLWAYRVLPMTYVFAWLLAWITSRLLGSDSYEQEEEGFKVEGEGKTC